MILNVIKQSQEDRDLELSVYLGVPVENIRALGIATPSSIRIARSRQDVVTRGHLDPAKVEDLYRKLPYLDQPAYFRTLMTTSMTRRPRSLLNFVGGLGPPDKLLDYGCGAGSHALIAAALGASTTILDLAGPIFDLAKWRFSYRGIPVRSLTPEDELDVYTHIVCAETLEHVPDPMETMRVIHKHLQTGGMLFLLVSSMIKDTSGHFAESIRAWQTQSRHYMPQNFDRVAQHIWRKR